MTTVTRERARTRTGPARRWPGTGLLRLQRSAQVLAGVLALAIVALLVYALWPKPERMHLTAYFPRAVGLYEGSDVRVLGVPIGTVERVTPEGTSVRVDMTYDAKYKIPADAKAVIIAPSIVSDRYVQLTPVYRGGPTLPDRAEIPLEDTAVPVELDRIYRSLDELAVALGPEGANRHGALSRLLEVGAANLDGEGKKVNAAIGDLADATQTLSHSRKDLFATVRQLQQFTSMLAANDDEVRELNHDLAVVADQLEAERGDLQLALDHLAVALTDISSFVRDNRDELRANVDDLTELSKVLVKQQNALREVLEVGPVALSNLDHAYNEKTGTLDTRDQFAQLDDPGLYLCSLLLQAGQPESLCDDLRGVLDGLELPVDAPASDPGGPSRDLTLGGILQ
ncbi:MAG TPA: MCE family protein [Actinopolymorphaceae bacterium]|jgi:phospholipid/cholesterol/gamma-HCH transport system substrate-binding protein